MAESEVQSPVKRIFPVSFNTIYLEDASSEDVLIFRASLHNMDDVKKWVKDYETLTRSDWIVLECNTSMEKYLLRRRLICKYSNRRKTESSTRSTNCKVELDIHIKLTTSSTKKSDKYLRTTNGQVPRPAVIKVKGQHNHHQWCADALRRNRIGDEAKRQLTSMFDDGFSPAQAKRFISDQILTDGKIVDLADNKKNPTTNTLHHQHKMWTKTNFGSDPLNPFSKIDEKTQTGYYKSKGVDVHVAQENGIWSILILTPLMRRIQKLSLAQETLFVDSTSHMDVSNCTFTALATNTTAGAMPLGILLHGQQTAQNYEQAFNLFKEHCPDGFGGTHSPDAVMTDDSAAERTALKNVWPISRLLLCLFHWLSKEWKWLISNCSKSERQGLMNLYNKAVYAESEQAFNEAVSAILSLSGKQDKFVRRFQKQLERQEEWALFQRLEICLRGHDTNNYAEISMKIMKEIVLQRTRALNVVALIEFIIEILEGYYIKRLLEHAHNRHTKHSVLYGKLLQRVSKIDVEQIVKLDDSLYQVPSATTNGKTYEVHTDSGFCECKAGNRGGFCKHMALLVEHFKISMPCAPPLRSSDRYELAKLALADDKCPEMSFFLSVTETASNDAETCREPDIHDSNGDEIENLQLEAESELHNILPQVEVDDEVERVALIKKAEESVANFLQLTREDKVPLPLLRNFISMVEKPKTPSAATGTMVAMYRSGRAVNRAGSYISVNPSGRSRRRHGVSKGSKQIPLGRPSNLEASLRGVTKKPRNLSQCVRNNVANAKSH